GPPLASGGVAGLSLHEERVGDTTLACRAERIAKRESTARDRDRQREGREVVVRQGRAFVLAAELEGRIAQLCITTRAADGDVSRGGGSLRGRPSLHRARNGLLERNRRRLCAERLAQAQGADKDTEVDSWHQSAS